MRTIITLAVASSFALAQASNLSLTNVRPTYGLLGPVRANTQVLPGDSLGLEFDIEGITIAADGKVQYSIGLDVTDEKGKVAYRQLPRDLEASASLGGKAVAAQAQLDIGLDQPAGDYTVKVTVTDRAAKQSQSVTQKVQVLPAEFGIVQLRTTSDPEGVVPAGLVGVGETLWISFAAVRFERDKGKLQPNVQFELRILDEAGKPTLTKPDSGTINQDVPAGDKLLGGQFQVALNRPGKFVVELKATDKVSGKTATRSFPLNVLPRR
ncbi:MAG: hypothetical protein JNM56_25965 [Planctomycetia bacterium]|nr:hypothetical protein [Planctomycetia bacterium]